MVQIKVPWCTCGLRFHKKEKYVGPETPPVALVYIDKTCEGELVVGGPVGLLAQLEIY